MSGWPASNWPRCWKASTTDSCWARPSVPGSTGSARSCPASSATDSTHSTAEEARPMDFAFDDRTEELRGELLSFMDEHVYPAEAVAVQQVAEAGNPWARPPVMEDLKAEARRRGLWNLFLPGEHGGGLTKLQYAPLAEFT